MKEDYESEIGRLNNDLKEAQNQITHTTQLYTREKIEKESNTIAYNRIIEQ
jgi:hypothetical protein